MKTILEPQGGDPTAEAQTLDDRLAAATPDDGRVAITVRLAPRHAEYLAQRAAMFGETPERHLETILRNFRAYFDEARPELAPPPAVRNGGPVVGRVA